MVHRLEKLAVVVMGVAVLAAWGCMGRPSRVHPPGINASAAGPAAMKEYDTDGDGKVAGAELDKAPSLKAALKNLDTNGDGAVSADEVTARIEKWQESKLGLTSLQCTVRYKGRPLGGATVTFEPEGFLGPNVKAATGTTTASGMAALSIPDNKLPGIAPGLYKVKITSNKMSIPAQYNTQTTLGCEVAQDALDMEQGIIFDLK